MSTNKNSNFIATMMLAAACVAGQAQTPARPETNDLIYVVKSGDTLWRIAKQHGVNPLALMQTNNLTSKRIFVSQKLILPPLGVPGTFPPGPPEPPGPPDTMSQRDEHTWLQSASQEVVLGLCDKNGNGDFSPLFVVTDPDGQEHAAPPDITDRKRKSGQENYAAGYVSFPSDFKTYWITGRYAWKCFVQSNCVAAGAFEYFCGTNGWSVIIK